MSLPLEGIRVLSVEQYGAGPFASLYLANMGATVIKIEAPGSGDNSRQSGPYFLGENDSHFFQTFNRSKRSLSLNLKHEDGKNIFLKLASLSDAVMNNLRGDKPDELGLTYSDLKALNQSIVCLHISGYGRKGSRATWPAYDYLLQSEAGFINLTGEPSGPASRMGLSIIDYLSGITAAFSVTAALLGAARTGKGRDVDVSLYDVAMHQLTYPATWYLNEGSAIERRPRSGHPSVVPCEIIPTADGQIFVMCVLPKFWEQLCIQAGLPNLPEDPLFKTPVLRYKNRNKLMEILDSAFSNYTTKEWISRLAGKVPAAPILTLSEALDSPYAKEADLIETLEHPQKPSGLRFTASPILLDGKRLKGERAPSLGENTDEILAELGYSNSNICEFRRKGVI